MVKFFEDADLAGYSLDIGVLVDFWLFEGFYCDFGGGGQVGGEVDFAEGALADGGACVVSKVPTR